MSRQVKETEILPTQINDTDRLGHGVDTAKKRDGASRVVKSRVGFLCHRQGLFELSSHQVSVHQAFVATKVAFQLLPQHNQSQINHHEVR